MDTPRLQRLTGAEARRLVATATIGRLTVPTPNFPAVEPAAFTVVGDDLVIGVTPGGAGDAVPPGTPLAFEADSLDPELRLGWSVVVTGPAEDLAPADASAFSARLRPWPAAAGQRLLRLRLGADQISGRRIAMPPSPAGAPAADSPDVAGSSGPDEPGAFRCRRLGAADALALLERDGPRVGRLAITLGGEPLVFPLNYAVDGDSIVFRTAVGTLLAGISRSLATFEVDRFDADGQGWSMVVEGLAQEVLDSEPVELWDRLNGLALDPWPHGDRPHVVRIRTYSMWGSRTVLEAVAVPSRTPTIR